MRGGAAGRVGEAARDEVDLGAAVDGGLVAVVRADADAGGVGRGGGGGPGGDVARGETETKCIVVLGGN